MERDEFVYHIFIILEQVKREVQICVYIKLPFRKYIKNLLRNICLPFQKKIIKKCKVVNVCKWVVSAQNTSVGISFLSISGSITAIDVKFWENSCWETPADCAHLWTLLKQNLLSMVHSPGYNCTLKLRNIF